MKRNLKKIASLFISIAMAFSMLTFSCIQASAMTNQDGADWALARIGQWIDTDGYYGAQCKDFVNAFTQDNFGVTFPGNACDLIYDSLPAGWQRIQNYAEFVPEPGDIAIWGGWNGNPYGHTAIIVSANLYTFDSVDQNWVNSSSNGSKAARVTHNYTNPVFWGVIRPPYQAKVQNVENPWINVNGSVFVAGNSVSFNLGATNATNYTIGIDKDGTRMITQDVGTNPSFTFNEQGNYTAYITAYNSVSYKDSNTVSFRVIKPQNLGTGFYGVIINTESWKPIGVDEYNVELQSEKGISEQVWKFERQNDLSYEIKSAKTGWNLDVYMASSTNGTNIQICPDNDGNAQRWYIISNGKAYTFVPKNALGSAMDLSNNKKEDKTNIQLYTFNASAAQTFSVYKEDDVQLKSPSLTVDPGINGADTVFKWSNVYGESSYNLKVWNNKANDGDAYCSDTFEENILSDKVTLSPGYYEAYIIASNYFETKQSGIVSFTVKPNVLLDINKKSKTLNVSWDEISKANFYEIDVYNADTDKLLLSYHNITDCKYTFDTRPGNYYLMVKSDTNVVSDKKEFVIKNYLSGHVGDINFDGRINKDDVTDLLNGAMGVAIGLDPNVSDINRDGKVNTLDVYQLNAYLNNSSYKNDYIGSEIVLDYEINDVNTDGSIDILDATQVQKYLAKIDSPTYVQNKLADCNGDGVINVRDATYIQKTIVKIPVYNLKNS